MSGIGDDRLFAQNSDFARQVLIRVTKLITNRRNTDQRASGSNIICQDQNMLQRFLDLCLSHKRI